MFSERLSDLLAVLLLALGGLSLYPRARGLVLVGVALVVFGLMLLAHGRGLQRLADRSASWQGRAGRGAPRTT